MKEEDGFVTVKYKFPKQNKFLGRKEKFTEDTSTFEHSSMERRLDLIKDDIHQYKIKLSRSPFYEELIDILSSRAASGSILPGETHFQDFVCYAIGKLSECHTARCQFALLVLLWEYLKPSGKCFIYDPIFCEVDKRIVEDFGFQLIPINEEAKRTVTSKTFFYIPHGGKALYNNILWANWGRGLRNVFIFGNKFSSYEERLPLRQLKAEAGYIAKILPYVSEKVIKKSFDPDTVFNDLALHSFSVDEQSTAFWEDSNEPIYCVCHNEIILNEK